MSVMTRPRLGKPLGDEAKRPTGSEAFETFGSRSSSVVRTTRRPKVLAGGVGLVLGSALLGAVLFSRGTEQRTAIVAASDIGVGEVITPAHLRVVRLARDADVASLPSSAVGQLVDRVAAVPITRGALVLPGQVNRTQSAPEGSVLVGAVLELGALPSPDLRFGDRVRVLVAPTNASIDNPPKVATEAVVWRVWGAQQGSGSRRAVTLAVPEAASVEVGAAAAQGTIRLLVVANNDSDAATTPPAEGEVPIESEESQTAPTTSVGPEDTTDPAAGQ